MASITGTNLRNILVGTSAADIIKGLAGNDDLFGRLGNDQLLGGIGDDKLFGEAGNDVIYGEDGNDLLDGGLGTDTMRGGKGNDVYIVDVSTDKTIELANEGTDLVKAGAGFTLGFNLENLTLTGALNINGVGNALNNVLTGNNRNNILSGGDGNDVISGLGGQDILIGGNGNDRLLPGPGNLVPDEIHGGAGDDTVDYSNALAVTIYLHVSVVVTGLSASGDVITGVENVIGSPFRDFLTSGPGGPFHLAAGGAGDDIINATPETYDRIRGDAGFDILYGDGVGSPDDFWLQYDLGMDKIYDFRTTEDHLFISKTEFNLATPAGSFINAAELLVGTADARSNSTIRLIFDTDTHILWADKNVSYYSGGAVPIAVLNGINTLSTSDIFVF